MDNKQNICVIFGGKSPEHEVSCRSAVSVIDNLDKSKYDIMTVGITKDGEWFLAEARKEYLTILGARTRSI